jgi:hypothetical protein
MLRYLILLVIGVCVAVIVYVRLAPHDVAGVHAQSSPRAPGNYDSDGGFLVVRQITASPDDILKAVKRAADGTGQTGVLAGSVADGLITFVTRTKLWGFPDYTTASIIPAGTVDNAGPLLMIDGRLRFGKFDLDVNKARIEAWLAALGPLTVPLDSANSDP